MILAGEELNSTPLYDTKGEIPERTVAVGLGIWHSPKWNFGHRKRALWSEGIRDWNVDWNRVSSTSVFLIKTASPPGHF